MNRDYHLSVNVLQHTFMDALNSLGGCECGNPSTMGDVTTMEQIIVKAKRPSEHRVVIYNDDATPLELVLIILVTVFSKSEEEAVKIIEIAEQNEKATIGIYSYDVAKSLEKNAKNVIRSFEANFGIAVPLRIETEEVPQA